MYEPGSDHKFVEEGANLTGYCNECQRYHPSGLSTCPNENYIEVSKSKSAKSDDQRILELEREVERLTTRIKAILIRYHINEDCI